MKLYAITTSDKGGREARKGGDNWIIIELRNGNTKAYELQFCGGLLDVYKYNGNRTRVFSGEEYTTSDNEKRAAA